MQPSPLNTYVVKDHFSTCPAVLPLMGTKSIMPIETKDTFAPFEFFVISNVKLISKN